MTEDPREPGLFDLPLEAPPPLSAPAEESAEESAAESAAESEAEPEVELPVARRRPARGAARPESLSLFDPEEFEREPAAPRGGSSRSELRSIAGELGRASASRSRPTASTSRESVAEAAPLVSRLLGSGGDLVVVGAAGAVAALGARWLEAPIGADQLAPLALFLLAWSFVYFVVPLAFWGATPGMSWAGVVARTSPSEPLSFGQAAMRWLGTWATWASFGLGGLLALSGRSLADRVSGSSTHLQLQTER